MPELEAGIPVGLNGAIDGRAELIDVAAAGEEQEIDIGKGSEFAAPGSADGHDRRAGGNLGPHFGR